MRFAAGTALLFLTGVLIAGAPKVVEEFSGKVVGVTDGDTLKVLVDQRPVTIRLEGIDAPEAGQSYGNKAKKALAERVAGKTVTVRKTGVDRYGRTLGIILANGTDINAKLIEDGWAWHSKKYNDEERLAEREAAARTAKRGLWADEQPLAPWDYRARQKSLQDAPSEAAVPISSYWLNTSSGVRHNQRCEHYHNTKQGRFCGPQEGRACGICGG